MKNKLRSPITYICVVLLNFVITYLLNYLFFKDNLTYFIMLGIGFIILSTIIDFIVANKLGYHLDLFAYNIEDKKYLLLNDIYLGNLFSIPLFMFITLIL